ncbi:hypothetical protein LTR74_017047 [Friedmanniomyces endolithicus]|nr:hypothetical protein LTR74_017047 [Friedmanniomyces endolithicus]
MVVKANCKLLEIIALYAAEADRPKAEAGATGAVIDRNVNDEPLKYPSSLPLHHSHDAKDFHGQHKASERLRSGEVKDGKPWTDRPCPPSLVHLVQFWACAGVPLGVFNIVSNFNIALQVQPQILTFLSLVTWIQCYYYERKWSISKALAVVMPVACVMGGIEAGLVFALRIGIRHGTQWPATLMAILAALYLALGVLEQYVAIYKQRSVEGISFLFCGIDALGDLTSTIAVIFEPKTSILGLVIYNVEFLMWMGIFACGGYYKLLPALKRQIKRRSTGDSARTSNEVGGGDGIAIHEMPSSTSVFRTPSAEHELRGRVAPSSTGEAS